MAPAMNFAARQGNFAYLRQEAHAALTSLSRLDAKLTAVAVSEIAAVGCSDKIPQPCGLPNSFTTAGTAVISLSSQRIISLMVPAMNFVRAEREFRVPPAGGTLYHR